MKRVLSSGATYLLTHLRVVGAGGLRGERGLAWGGDTLLPTRPSHSAIDVSLSDHLAFPGLVNAHDHLTLNGFPHALTDPVLAPRLPVPDAAEWVALMAARLDEEPYVTLRAVPAAARAWQGAMKNLLSGATTVVHHDPPVAAFRQAGFPVRVPAGLAWCHSVGLAGRYGPGLAAAWAGAGGRGPFFVHVAEARPGPGADAEVERLLTVVDRPSRLRAVHLVGAGAAARARLTAAGAGMVWCPASNQALLGRPAPVADFAARGRAALGTDSRLSGGRDLLAELGFARRAGLAGAEALRRMVGPDGARLIGRPDRGRLAAGLRADLLVLRDDGRSPAEQLCAATRSELRLVVTRGRPLVADPDLADLFDAGGEPPVACRLDGQDKLVDGALWRRWRGFGLDEPGLAEGHG